MSWLCRAIFPEDGDGGGGWGALRIGHVRGGRFLEPQSFTLCGPTWSVTTIEVNQTEAQLRREPKFTVLPIPAGNKALPLNLHSSPAGPLMIGLGPMLLRDRDDCVVWVRNCIQR